MNKTYLKVQLLTKLKQFSVHLYMYAAVINHQLLYLPQTLFHRFNFFPILDSGVHLSELLQFTNPSILDEEASLLTAVVAVVSV